MPARFTTAWAGHSLVRPIPRSDSLPAALAALGATVPDRLWMVDTRDLRDGPRATRRREIERRRPLATGAAVRCVLLQHLDGADVVLVADRGLVPPCCLCALATAVTGPPGDALPVWKTHLDSADHVAASGVPAEPRPSGLVVESAVFPADHVADPDALVAAVGTLCAAILRQDGVSVVLEKAGCVTQAWRVDRDGTRTPDPIGQAQIGVLVADNSPHEYLPVLGAPYPITVYGWPTGDGSFHLQTCVRTDQRLGSLLATQLRRRASAGRFRLTPQESADILRAGHGPDAHFEERESLHDAFTAVARAHPNRVAITHGADALTYRELDELSRTAGQALVGRGVGVGERVGVCMERTAHSVIALLAVLRAGGCYVPLDPAHPAVRREYTAADAGLRLLITDGENDTADFRTVSMHELLAAPDPHPLPRVTGADLAYIIYTSGTTGRPKGAVVAHRSVQALLSATRHEFELAASDVWTLFHSPAFDFSVWETWGCLLTGGRLVIVPREIARTPQQFTELLHAERVTVLSQTPSAFANLVPAAIADARTPYLRLVVFGGEALRTPSLTGWLRRFPAADCRLVNMYGITETTVHVTWTDVTAADVVANSRSVGRPLAGWSVSIRSGDGRILPFEVAGEIWVGGAGLAVGYHERPELTAERFPVDPHSGTRYYRSGDLGRLRPDGTLEHLGRVDDQVKVRGYRVELGEVRAAVLDDPAVRDAVVAFREDESGGTIRAYLVAPATTTPELRRRLRARLPDYMIPAELRLIDAIPLTANGKTDLSVLDSAPDNAVAETSVDPATAVVRAWTDLFGPDCTESDFFELGGTSLHALKLALLLDDLTDRRVGPQDVYLHPTVAELIALVR